MSDIDYTKIPECDIVVSHINTRLKKGLNINIYIIGLSGTGKSSTSLRLGELISESREIKPQVFVVDSLLELLKALRKAKEGDIIIIEEVSVLFPSRRAMAKSNVNIGKVLDTCRKKLLCIISNAPLWNGIDSHMRAMGHLIIETLRINKIEGVVISKFHRLQTNPMSGKTYRHTMQRGEYDVARLYTRKPNSETWNKYEKNKDIFMENLYTQLEHEEKLKKTRLEKSMRVVKPEIKTLSKQYLQIHHLVNVEKKSQTEVSKIIGVTPSRISQIMKEINNISEIPKENQ